MGGNRCSLLVLTDEKGFINRQHIATGVLAFDAGHISYFVAVVREAAFGPECVKTLRQN